MKFGPRDLKNSLAPSNVMLRSNQNNKVPLKITTQKKLRNKQKRSRRCHKKKLFIKNYNFYDGSDSKVT